MGSETSAWQNTQTRREEEEMTDGQRRWQMETSARQNTEKRREEEEIGDE
jgi:hypothetical protein